MVEVAPARAIAFERTMAPERRHLSLRIGVAAAVASVGPSLARGLLPRTATDQAMVTGATAAYALGFSALGQSVVESVADVIVRRRHGGNPEYVVLAASAIVGAAAAVVRAAVLDDHTVALPLATAQSGARVVSAGALAGALVVGSDLVLDRTMGPRGLPVSLAVAGVIGAGAGAVQIARQRRRARRHRESPPRERRRGGAKLTAKSVAHSVGVGAAVGGGLVAVVGAQFAIAEGTTLLIAKLLDQPPALVPPIVGHAAAASVLTLTGAAALNRVRLHVMHADDIVEPAYPDAAHQRTRHRRPGQPGRFDDDRQGGPALRPDGPDRRARSPR